MKKRTVLFCFIFGIAVMLNGCASSRTLQTSTPLTVKMADYKTVFVAASSKVSSASEEIAELESMTVSKLSEKNMFAKVISGTAPSDAAIELRLNLKIVELKKVSRGDRAMSGALAGKARIVVEAELVDAKTNKAVGAFTVEGESSAHSIFAGTTSQAIENAVEAVVAFVQKSV